jgi:hypothetical protein
MKVAKLSFEFGKGHVCCKKICSLACPNGFGGIGKIIVVPTEKEFWTGEVCLQADTFQFSFGNVRKIETFDDYEEYSDDNGPWALLWQRQQPFTYEQYELAAKLLKAYLI